MKNMIVISVSAYCAGVSIAAVIYYAALLLFFKFRDRQRLTPKIAEANFKESFFIRETDRSNETADAKPKYTAATFLTDELKSFFDEFSGDDLTKEEVAFRLRKIIAKYSEISESFKETVNHYIYTSADENFRVQFSDEELNQLHSS